jgi:hypothetical protein
VDDHGARADGNGRRVEREVILEITTAPIRLNMKHNPQTRPGRNCPKAIKDAGRDVIILSGIGLLGGVMGFVNSSPPMGEMGHFMHDFTLALAAMSAWGVATGIGLGRAWRWAWISMLMFGGLLTMIGILLALPFLFIPGGGVAWWEALALRGVGFLFFLVGAAIGVRWFVFFTRENVKAYFRRSRNTPAASPIRQA